MSSEEIVKFATKMVNDFEEARRLFIQPVQNSSQNEMNSGEVDQFIESIKQPTGSRNDNKSSQENAPKAKF